MLDPNTTLQNGRYRIIQRIGQGGMATVYEAYDNNLSNRVAIKEALVTDRARNHAFEREAQRLDRLRHVALPMVKDHFVEGGERYLVMEFIDGEDLKKRLEQGGQPFAVGQVLAWADTLLDALGYLHQEGVIHRDIKPANIKLTPKGQIILLDFGLAKGGLTRDTVTALRLHGFTHGYAPPEQIAGEPTNEPSDLYALGATLYALLTGRVPDSAALRQNYINRGDPDPLQPANKVNRQVPRHVAQALQQVMALNPAQRPASAAEVQALLKVPRSLPDKPNWPSQLLGITMVAALLFCVLVGAYVMGNEPSIVSEGPAGTEAIAVVPTETTTLALTATPSPPTSTIEVLPTESAILVPTAAPPPTSTIEVLPTETAILAPTAAPPPPIETATLAPIATPIAIPEPTATLVPGAQKDGMEQVYVPAGEFEMGSAEDDPNAYDYEKPRHTVYLNAFFMDQTEVTNAMFANFLNEMGNQEEGGVRWLDEQDEGVLIEQVNGIWEPKSGFANHPVIEVSWYAANAYCQWAERRLPTEAEWEKAAGGTDGRKWPWGNDAPTCEKAQISSCEGNTAAVGTKLTGASPYGALDMAGNVWEWVSDSYDRTYYASSPRENPTGPSQFGSKLLRGGFWNDLGSDTRVRNRSWNNAYNRAPGRGFRCARSP
ncbi:MAG: SUMF1/EgtB/PvdO family nonheme iron enzyme [Ardenticatenaceae bacterium]